MSGTENGAAAAAAADPGETSSSPPTVSHMPPLHEHLESTGAAAAAGAPSGNVQIVNMVPGAGGVGGQTASSASMFPLTEDELRMKEEEDTFYSAKDNKHGDDNVWGLLSGVAGNVYEWYDFAVYGLLASEIGAAFFPQSSKELQLIDSFGVYLAAFLMRPLGAIVFGELGDRLVGRKNALVFSIILITVPSVLMGCLPGYDTWGVVSPILLVLLRMMQGLSVGGQLAGSYVLSIEQSSSSNRGFRGSICDASSVGGFLLASFVTTCVRWIFTDEQVDEWAWRVPFLLSLVLAPALYYIVSKSKESKFWAESKDQKETEKIIRENEMGTDESAKRPAVLDLVSSPFRRRQLAGMIGVLSPMTSSYYTLFLFSPVYLSNLRGHMSEAGAGALNVFVLSCYVVLILIGGRLSDSFPHRMDLMRIGLPGIIVAAPVMYGLYESESVVGYALGQLQYAFCMSLFQGGIAAWKVELWMADPTLSYTGVAIGHNVSSCIFGGTIPLVSTFLYFRGQEILNNYSGGDDSSRSGNEDEELLWPRLLPGFYMSILGCVSLFCLSCVIRHPHDIRTGEKKMRDAYAKDLRRKRKKLSRKMRKGQAAVEGYLSSPSISFVGSDLGSLGQSPSYVPPSASGR